MIICFSVNFFWRFFGRNDAFISEELNPSWVLTKIYEIGVMVSLAKLPRYVEQLLGLSGKLCMDLFLSTTANHQYQENIVKVAYVM